MNSSYRNPMFDIDYLSSLLAFVCINLLLLPNPKLFFVFYNVFSKNIRMDIKNFIFCNTKAMNRRHLGSIILRY